MDLIYDDIELHVDVPVTNVNNQSKDVFIESPMPLIVTPDEGFTGLSSVEVYPLLQIKTKSITTSGQTLVRPDEGYCGLDHVYVNVSIPQTRWLLKNIEYNVGYFDNEIFSSFGSFYSTSSTYVSLTPSNNITLCVYGEYSYSGSGLRKIKNLAYMFYHVNTAMNFNTTANFGFQPNFSQVMTFDPSVLKPTSYDPFNDLEYYQFNFKEYDQSFVETGKSQSFRVSRCVDLANMGIQHGSLISMDSSGFF